MEHAEKPRVKCATCGFLAKHAVFTGKPLPIPTFYEAEEVERQTGHGLFTHVPTAFLGPVATEPVCFARQIRIPFLVGQQILGQEEKQQKIEAFSAALNVISAERICDWWNEYQPGFSPKEHLEIRNMEQLEWLRQRFAEDRERDRRAFEQRLQRDSTKVSNGLIIAALIIGFFQLLAAFMAMTRDSLFMKWWLGR